MSAAARPLEALCRKCKGFGFTGDIPAVKGGWLARDVFERGVACNCEAGVDFALTQLAWRKTELREEATQ